MPARLPEPKEVGLAGDPARQPEHQPVLAPVRRVVRNAGDQQTDQRAEPADTGIGHQRKKNEERGLCGNVGDHVLQAEHGAEYATLALTLSLLIRLDPVVPDVVRGVERQPDRREVSRAHLPTSSRIIVTYSGRSFSAAGSIVIRGSAWSIRATLRNRSTVARPHPVASTISAVFAPPMAISATLYASQV